MDAANASLLLALCFHGLPSTKSHFPGDGVCSRRRLRLQTHRQLGSQVAVCVSCSACVYACIAATVSCGPETGLAVRGRTRPLPGTRRKVIHYTPINRCRALTRQSSTRGVLTLWRL